MLDGLGLTVSYDEVRTFEFYPNFVLHNPDESQV